MPQNTFTIEAHGKINWTLDVLAKRPDGLHEISSIMQQIALSDRLTFERRPGGIQITVSGPEADRVPMDQTNLVWRAVQALGVDDVAIDIEKNIPNQAGLGGGSSDAAATLKAINTFCSLGLALPKLTEIASGLGADVPFFLTGKIARVGGFGDRVTLIEPIAPIEIVLLKPDVGVSTADAYRALDAIPGRLSSNSTGSWDGTRRSNDFEDVVYTLYPAVERARQLLVESGAAGTLLCGSGAAVMGWGDDLRQIAANVRSAGSVKVWVTQTL